MYFPFITKRSSQDDKKLHRRKGGGGGGKSGGGGRSGGAGGGSGSARSSGSISSGGTSRSATAFGGGGGPSSAIPSGQLFAGRLSGGGTRGQVYGNSQYGSGYPGVAGRGTAGRGFPFVFWPLAFGGAAGIGTAAYLHTSDYGRYDNSSRPGGIMMIATFPSSSQNTTFRLIADNTTVISLIEDIVADCSSNINSPTTITPTAYNDSLAFAKPEQAVQYYRASSVALTLDGYNNTGALGPEGTPDTPLPSNIDTNLLNCLNATIGEAVPLVGGAGLRWSSPPSVGLVGLAYVLWCMTSMI
ncbi:hypothetical protein B0H34DRAFT_652185 [Crassisporium funariophilum]|nr:hypothetical protein B0H34DRAFT_652185 [Crassisporium funariophilum]